MNLYFIIAVLCISTANGLQQRWYYGTYSRGWDYYFRTPRRTAYKVRVPTTKIAATSIRYAKPTEAEWRTRWPTGEEQGNQPYSYQTSRKNIFKTLAMSSTVNSTPSYRRDTSTPKKTSRASGCCFGSYQRLWDFSQLFKKAIEKLTPTEFPQVPSATPSTFPVVTSSEHITSATSVLEPSEAKSHIRDHASRSEIFQKCSNIKHKFLAEVCRRVAKNPVLREMERNGRGVRGRIGTEELGRGSIRPNTLFCSSPKVCPTYHTEDDELLSKMQSLSPWTICSEYDANRFPQWINTAKCLCDRCIDPETGKEGNDYRDVFSQEIKLNVTVLRKISSKRTFASCNRNSCYQSTEQISIGCYCSRPKMPNFKNNKSLDKRFKQYNQNIGRLCSKFKNFRMRMSCRTIAHNHVLEVISNGTLGLVGEEEMAEQKKMEKISSNVKGVFGQYPHSMTICNTNEKCRDHATERADEERTSMNLSPWKMCREYNPFRFPQWISKAKCLCNYCINPVTMKEQVDGAISEPLTATVTVLKKNSLNQSFRKCTKETCHEELEEVPIGCHCTMHKS